MIVVTFGEIMGRFAPIGQKRFAQSMPGTLELTFAGAEANVAVSLAQLQSPHGENNAVRFVSALPRGPLGDACTNTLQGLGVDTRFVIRPDEGRLGLFFVETGANQRPSGVVYDRDGSSISLASYEIYPGDEIFQDAGWLHVSGITPAISAQAAEATLVAVKRAREQNLTVSCDLNFRKKLWRWDPDHSPGELAQKTVRQILPYVNMVIANEEDAATMLGIHAAHTDVEAGELAVDRYPEVAREIVRQFDNVTHVAITLRESISASHNNWGAMLYESASEQAWFAPLEEGQYCPYQIRNIVDRVGAGDSFAAGLIFCLNTEGLNEPPTAIRFAVAASCLAHSISGDFNFSSRAEVESLMGGAATGRVVR